VCLRPEPYSRVIAAISWHEPPGGAAAIRPAMGLEYRTAVAAPSTIPEFFGGEPAARKKGRQEMPAKWSRPVFSFRFYEGKISHCPHCIRRLP
jgi:hypothetical protein